MSSRDPGSRGKRTKKTTEPRARRSRRTPAGATGQPAEQAGGDAPQPSATDDLRELAQLVRDVSQETTTLLRQEIELAKTELADKGKQAGLGAGLFGAAGVMGLLTAGAFTSLLILALAEVVAPWLAALIVTALYGAVAGILALTGKKKVEEATPLVPEQAVEAAKSAKDKVQSSLQRGS